MWFAIEGFGNFCPTSRCCRGAILSVAIGARVSRRVFPTLVSHTAAERQIYQRVFSKPQGVYRRAYTTGRRVGDRSKCHTWILDSIPDAAFFSETNPRIRQKAILVSRECTGVAIACPSVLTQVTQSIGWLTILQGTQEHSSSALRGCKGLDMSKPSTET